MAHRRHARDTNARRSTTRTAVLISVVVAASATTASVALGLGGDLGSARSDTAASMSRADSSAANPPQREDQVSRGRSRLEQGGAQAKAADYRGHRMDLEQIRREFQRLEAAAERRATREAIRDADTRMWATEDLNVWSDSGKRAENLGLIEAGERVLLTGREADGRTEVVLGGRSRWVSSGYFSEEEPSVLDGECTNGSSVPSAVSPNIQAVHQAVCANFPEITVYGTLRSDGEHSQGIAIDIMVSGDRGWQVAEFLQDNYVDLGIDYIIYSQSIWQPSSSYSGWQGMEDRGSITANHYDHVHVTTY